MRSLAVAEEARDRALPVRFVVTDDPVAPVLVRRWGFDVVTLPNAKSFDWASAIREDDLVVFDGYHFGTEEFAGARRRGARVAAVDDLGRGRFFVDVLLNQNPAPTTDYEVDPTTVTLVGPRYALVRKEFRRHRRRRSGGTGELVVVFGGSDSAGVLDRALEGIEHRPAFKHVTAVVGPAARGSAALEHGRPWLTVVRPSDIAAVFDRADAVVSAAGSTTWELLCMGLPTALIQVADNQRDVGPNLAQRGAALFLGEVTPALRSLPDSLSELAKGERQRSLSKRALELVDGLGASRFINVLLRGR